MATNDILDLNFDEVISLIQEQLLEHINSDGYREKYEGIELFLSNEQQFMKLKDKKPNAIYIVVQFGNASINFGQTVLPASISVMTQQNNINTAYNLMYEYAQRYNLVNSEDGKIKQVYESPSMSGNFNEVYEGFRSIITLSAAFVIGGTANEYKVYYYYKEDEDGPLFAEEVPQITSSFMFVGSPDTQVFYNTRNFAKSEIGFGSVALGFTMFALTDSRIMNDILSILGNVVEQDGNKSYVISDTTKKIILDSDVEPTNENINEKVASVYDGNIPDVTELKNISIISPIDNGVYKFEQKNSQGVFWRYDYEIESVIIESDNDDEHKVNKTFRLGVVYKDGKHARIKDYKLADVKATQDIGEIPVVSLDFVE